MSAKNTSAILKRLRGLMSNKKYVTEQIHAYIVPSGDAHQSEYITACDCRREFVSGFSGSAGTAIITKDKAALWTDGRYYLQAERQLDGNWTLMKDGMPKTPSQSDWLSQEMPVGGCVGVDPHLISAGKSIAWDQIRKNLKNSGHHIVPVHDNLIDVVWDDRPPPPKSSLLILSLKYTGMSWQDKVKKIREKMKVKKCEALVVTALDEIAYLFNLRGADIEFNPVFFAYAVVTMNSVNLFIDETRLDEAVSQHLQLNGSNTDPSTAITVHPYGEIGSFMSGLAEKVQGKVWERRLSQPSPVASMKAVKNKTEIAGMKRAHVKDAVTLCEYFSWLEQEVPKGKVTEVSAAEKLEQIKQEQEDYISLSFATISSTGPNGAIIHYKATEETDQVVAADNVYLCDSGAQYRDGTTDVTRTTHFGTPSSHVKECYTRVLKGHINLSSAIFPNGVKGHMLDSLARTSLWDIGLDYVHGTGHGVGCFLNVHEGPCGISHRVSLADVPLEEGMILSDEPGYYEDGAFGLRIENCVLVVKADTKHNFKDKGFLTFEPLTLVPMFTRLIDPSLLSQKEIDWLNDYHSKCLQIVGEELMNQGKTAAFKWLKKEAQIIG
ncbi:hypothetical protein FSP39_011006 [Pinctada imbricata]|uniref:Xaa-Pro aminopeptidase 1 n=1 Tax=Pinctada imbricata TaxID=66713 RepID=A0AA88XZR6_PINIB|nr:hypothetical protein FSP39_011006 [Pinctada imbricata]